MDIPLEDAKNVRISTNDSGEHLKITCSVCGAETYARMPSTLAVLMALTDTHTHQH
ncbi:MAG TPA: hypothetical protein VFB06_34470 [Streptosporangiaceae bacterium]|nr:hypothetical protein [Streptosporangiaceae bacterium]